MLRLVDGCSSAAGVGDERIVERCVDSLVKFANFTDLQHRPMTLNDANVLKDFVFCNPVQWKKALSHKHKKPRQETTHDFTSLSLGADIVIDTQIRHPTNVVNRSRSRMTT